MTIANHNLDSSLKFDQPCDSLYAALRNLFIVCFLMLSFGLQITQSVNGQERKPRSRKEVQQLIRQTGKISQAFEHHVETLWKDGESADEITEICTEFLDEFNEIKSEHGVKSARAWSKVFEAELEIEKLIDDTSDSGIKPQKLKNKILDWIDADIKFELSLLQEDDEDEVEEINIRRSNREREATERIEEIMAELKEEWERGDEHGHEDDEEDEEEEVEDNDDGDDDGDGEGDDEDEDRDDEDREIEQKIRRALANRKPIQPLQLTAAEIKTAQTWKFETRVEPVLSKACYDCHGEGSDDGNLDIEALLTQKPLVKNSERWRHIIAQIENRTMPPPKTYVVNDRDRKIIAAWLRSQLENFDFASVRNAGFESAKRLTHEEYNNTIRDLIGIDLRPADRLPADLSTNLGFENSANSLFLTDSLLERYVGLAEYIVQNAYPIHGRNEQQQKAWDQLFVKVPGDGVSEVEAAKTIFSRFLPRVYRTTVEADEVDAMMQGFLARRKKTTDFSSAILSCVQSTLTSPRFLLRVEAGRKTDDPYQVKGRDLANRLSYFLWASMPDERLFRLADSGKLTNPETLEAEVQRMLADPKSQSLGRSFAGQWLGFEHLGTRIRLDPIDNPWCTDSLMDSMKNETGMFFVSLLRDDRPLQDLIDPKYTFLNEELARFYKIKNVRGRQMRRVRLDSDRRGGIFSQGSILAVTSFPDRTSPVTRGAWVLTNVLGERPPNPPPNASQLSEELEMHDSLTQRQKLEFHRRKTHCAACHDQIDPLGFALEKYDLFGRFRNRSEEGRRIDANSELPDGTQINGLAGLKAYVKEQKLKDVLTHLTRRMLAYALGRQLEYYDEAAVRKIVATVIADDWKMQTLLLEITKSYPFQFKQNPSASGRNNKVGR